MARANSIAERNPTSDLNLDQVLSFIRQLDAAARSRVARALAESEMDARLGALIRRLAEKSPVDDISDREIQAEVDAVRMTRVRAPC